MTDRSDANTPTQPGEVPITSGRKSFWDSASLIWAIPVIALVVALGAAWRSYTDQGPLIAVSFAEAAGIKAGETQLRFRDITVGAVEDVGFSEDLANVVVSIRVEKEMADYINADARFWVVRPQVTAQGVTGLDTVLSGVYIQGAWDTETGPFVSDFTGLDGVPLLGAGREGITFTLRSSESLPGAGTPILYKNVQVGVVGEAQVTDDGTGVTAEAAIFAPHTSFVTTSTRFWDISGFSFSLGASGAKLNFTSLASLVSGGVTFEEIGSGGTALTDGMVFDLFPNEEAARDDFLVAGEGTSVDFSMVFEENLSGLSTGSAVELGGLRVGEVTSINGIMDQDRFGDTDVRLLASVRINPNRLGLGEGADEADLINYLDTRIDQGLRAQLVNASLFTGGLKIALTEVPGAAPATLDRRAEPLPSIPTAAANVTDVGATAQGTLERVSALPIEEVMQSVIDFLDNASGLIGSDDLQRAPAELTGILTAVREVAESDGIQALPDQIGALLSDLQTASTTLNDVVTQLETEQTVGKLTTAIENAGAATEPLPGLVEDLRAGLANVQDVPLEALSQSVTDLLASADAVLARADALIAGDDVQAVPAELRGILASIRDVTENDAVQALPDRATALLDGLQDTIGTFDRLMNQLETQNTIGQLTTAINDVATAADGLPPLVDQARGILEGAAEVPLDQLATQAGDLIASANRLVNQDSTRQLPSELNAALSAIQTTLSELQDGGLVSNANATLASARDAADAIAEATASLPQLAEDLRRVAGQADATLQAYSGDSEFSRDTLVAIREIQSAANAIEKLARTIERNPNSLLLGR